MLKKTNKSNNKAASIGDEPNDLSVAPKDFLWYVKFINRAFGSCCLHAGFCIS